MSHRLVHMNVAYTSASIISLSEKGKLPAEVVIVMYALVVRAAELVLSILTVKYPGSQWLP